MEEMDAGMVLDTELHGRTLPHAEVLLVRLERQLAAFAVCDLVDLSSVRTCHVKLIAVRPGIAPEACLPELLHLAGRFASEQRCERLMWGVGSEQQSSVSWAIAGDWIIHERAQCMIRRGGGDEGRGVKPKGRPIVPLPVLMGCGKGNVPTRNLGYPNGYPSGYIPG